MKNNKDNKNNESKNLISFEDVNYAIYKVGKWKNSYKINLIGTSKEVPVTEITKNHLLSNIEEIRKSTFEISGKKVNGILGLSIQLDPNLNEENIDDLIVTEQEEYDNIISEINSLEFEDSNGSIELDTDEFLIYKLEKDHHVTVSKPANNFTMNHHVEEIKKLKENSNTFK